MAELKELIPFTKNLSLLYIDEEEEILKRFVDAFVKVFQRVDDASDATAGIGYMKLNTYDLIIIDASSSVMNIFQLLKNIKAIHKYQKIIVTVKNLEDAQLLKIYALGVNAVVSKPFNISSLLDDILSLVSTLHHDRNFNASQIEKLNSDLLYERKRIGRFMLSEKKLNEKIKTFEDNIYSNKNIYELTRLPSRYALQTALNGTRQSLLYLNIDHFDFVNTVYGMGKANKLLKECSARLKKFLPSNGELFHITADEFVILLNEPSQNQDTLLATQMQALFKEAALEFDDLSHSVVFSIGIDRGAGKVLFVNAKFASKEARYFGGNQITFFNAQSDYMKEQRENLYWIRVLKKAFE